MHCRVFTSTLASTSSDADNATAPKSYVSTHCQVFPGRQDHLQLKIASLH
jgi:hypothetical protein